jgi:hypothetical protein
MGDGSSKKKKRFIALKIHLAQDRERWGNSKSAMLLLRA